MQPSADSNSHRHFYYRNNATSSIIELCTQILQQKPISAPSSTIMTTDTDTNKEETNPKLFDVNNLAAYDSHFNLSRHEITSLCKNRLLFIRGCALVRKGDHEQAVEDLSAGELSLCFCRVRTLECHHLKWGTYNCSPKKQLDCSDSLRV